ncbi:MAG TPA: PD-(D/E)XK nuclease family protein [Chthoniobacterales bacterium]|jgi:hypothetical protein
MQRVSLHIGDSPQDIWAEIVRPWFESVAVTAQSTQGVIAVITPFRSNAYAIKRHLVENGMSVLGVRFMSPVELRELLAARTQNPVAPREHLRLLLSIAAEQCMGLPEDPVSREARMLEPDFLAAKSVVRAPDHLLHTIGRLGAAGWDLTAAQLPALREIAANFQRLVADCGFELIHEADRRALNEIGQRPPLFTNLLMTGFNGAHWPLWPLLQAAVRSATEAVVLLEDPRDQTRDIDEAWIGTWEEMFGEAKPISARINQPADSLFSEAEMQGVSSAPADRSFLVGANTTEQAKAVATQCLEFLAHPKCERIGIVFSGSGALPRLVADELARLEIPHHDGISHLVPGIFEAADWRGWLQLQQDPRVNSLLQFVNAFSQRDELLCGLKAQAFERTLRSAYAQVLIDDLDILQRFCAQQPGDIDKSVARVLASIPFLPARALLKDFLHATKTGFDQLGWKAHWMEITRRLGDWVDQLDIEFSRGLYLRWLGDNADTFAASREPAGDHPYARVQLLTVPQADGQEWSHVIFAGWNEGSWPPHDTGEFVREDEIDAFNRSIQKLNRHAMRQGRQGEGHTTVEENHTLYLGSREQRQIASRQFERLLESTTQEIAFTASLVQPDAPERIWNPSELFTRHYQEARNSPLTQQTMTQLQLETARWLSEAEDSGRKSRLTSEKNDSPRIAYDARRDLNASSSEYDFAFHSKPAFVPTLSVGDFEQLVSAPALVWLKKYLGVKAAEEDNSIWNTSSGKWVHGWLAAITAGTARRFTRLPDPAEMDKRLAEAAEAKRLEVTRLCQATGKSVPDWWTGGWRNAVFLARILAEKLATVEDWPWMATEWTIEDEQVVQITDKASLSLRGRIDLLLARKEPAADSLETEDLWIVDYKTGAKKALAAGKINADGHRPAVKKKLLDGSALQLGLYALAASTLGAGQVEVSLLSPFVRSLTPQMSGADFASETEIFAELARMQQTGIFGMHGPLRAPFRFQDDYPLATLAVDPDILEQRWELTHPALVRDEEDILW